MLKHLRFRSFTTRFEIVQVEVEGRRTFVFGKN
jgi:hypothetical protein